MSYNAYNMMDNFRCLDQWISILNTQATDSIQAGRKTKRILFQGGAITSDRVSGGAVKQFGEACLSTSEAIDFSQGQVESSNSLAHMAVKGEGWFPVATSLAQGAQVFFTRDGEFHVDDQGCYRTRSGLYLLSADDIQAGTNTVGPGAIGVSQTTATGNSQYGNTQTVGGVSPATWSQPVIGNDTWVQTTAGTGTTANCVTKTVTGSNTAVLTKTADIGTAFVEQWNTVDPALWFNSSPGWATNNDIYAPAGTLQSWADTRWIYSSRPASGSGRVSFRLNVPTANGATGADADVYGDFGAFHGLNPSSPTEQIVFHVWGGTTFNLNQTTTASGSVNVGSQVLSTGVWHTLSLAWGDGVATTAYIDGNLFATAPVYNGAGLTPSMNGYALANDLWVDSTTIYNPITFTGLPPGATVEFSPQGWKTVPADATGTATFINSGDTNINGSYNLIIRDAANNIISTCTSPVIKNGETYNVGAVPNVSFTNGPANGSVEILDSSGNPLVPAVTAALNAAGAGTASLGSNPVPGSYQFRYRDSGGNVVFTSTTQTGVAGGDTYNWNPANLTVTVQGCPPGGTVSAGGISAVADGAGTASLFFDTVPLPLNDVVMVTDALGNPHYTSPPMTGIRGGDVYRMNDLPVTVNVTTVPAGNYANIASVRLSTASGTIIPGTTQPIGATVSLNPANLNDLQAAGASLQLLDGVGNVINTYAVPVMRHGDVYDLTISNTPMTFTGVPAGGSVQLLDANGNVLATAGTGPGPVTMPPVLGAVTVRIIDAAGQVIPNTTLPITANAGGSYSFGERRGMLAAMFTSPNTKLQYSNYGTNLMEVANPTNVAALQKWGTNGAGTLITGALEASNATVQQLSAELMISKVMYGHLTKVLQARNNQFDAILSLVR